MTKLEAKISCLFLLVRYCLHEIYLFSQSYEVSAFFLHGGKMRPSNRQRLTEVTHVAVEELESKTSSVP